MLPLLISSQIREADAYTIAHESIASIDLMERASKTFVGTVRRQFAFIGVCRAQHYVAYGGYLHAIVSGRLQAFSINAVIMIKAGNFISKKNPFVWKGF